MSFIALQIQVPKNKLVLGPSDGAFTDYYYPGFPTMKYLEYSVSLHSVFVFFAKF